VGSKKCDMPPMRLAGCHSVIETHEPRMVRNWQLASAISTSPGCKNSAIRPGFFIRRMAQSHFW
jgi:hypothetical protein